MNTIFGNQNFNRKFKNKFNFCLWRLFCCWHNQVCRCMFVSRRKKNAFALLKFYLFINGVLHACDRRCNLEKKEWLDLIITLWGAWDRDRCDLQWLCRRLESFWTFISAINMTDHVRCGTRTCELFVKTKINRINNVKFKAEVGRKHAHIGNIFQLNIAFPRTQNIGISMRFI